MSQRIVNVAVGFAALILSLSTMAGPAGSVETKHFVYAPVGNVTNTPAGYLQFCRSYPEDCRAEHEEPRDVVLSEAAWRDLVAVNTRVNQAIEPVTDLDNYGTVEFWAYPENGRGDCEDYVLLKRKLLISAGWPRSALLVTVVRDRKGDGHAVLMVKTDRGEFVLDNQETRIRRWEETGYRYVKRQSQEDQNVWVSLGDTQTTAVVAAGGDESR
jgi:predicted transglutaminase-like cysteine proteinase